MTLQEFKGLKTRGKYNNQKTIYNGRQYHSKKEAERAFQLDLMVRAGIVKRWTPQPQFKIQFNRVQICSYFADFEVHYFDGRVEIEDVKGVRTDIYKLKKKLVFACYGIIIKEI